MFVMKRRTVPVAIVVACVLLSSVASFADSVLQVGTGYGQDGQQNGTVDISASNTAGGPPPAAASQGAPPPVVSAGNASSGSGGSGSGGNGSAAGPTPSCGLAPAPSNVIAPGSAGLSWAPIPGVQGAAGLGAITAIQQGTPGSWYLDSCNMTLGSPLAVFVPGSGATGGGPAPGAPPPPPPPPSPAQLAQIAYGEIQLTAPGLQLSPSSQTNPAIDQIVNAPTWAWVPAGSWQPLTATAAAGPVVVTATATPSSLNVTYGDGSDTHTATCNGPGTPYSDQLANQEDPGAPLSAASPDCGWTYQHTSAGAPGGKEPVTGVVTYHVTWTVTGAPGGGDLGSLNSPPTAYDVPVAEIQVVNTN